MVQEAQKAVTEPKVELPAEADNEEAEWVSFRALLTPSMAKALNHFCKLNGIKIEKGE